MGDNGAPLAPEPMGFGPTERGQAKAREGEAFERILASLHEVALDHVH